MFVLEINVKSVERKKSKFIFNKKNRMNTNKQKTILEECFGKAEKLLKEYTLSQKSKLISLINYLTQWNTSELNKSPDKSFANDLEKLTGFYKYYDGSFYEVEDESVYNEFKSKLVQLAEKYRVSLPENLK